MSDLEETTPNELLGLITGSWKTQAVSATARLGVADALAREAMNAADLAEKLGLNHQATARLLSALTTLNICVADEDGRFGLTNLGRLLAKDTPGSLHHWAIWWGQYCWPEWGDLTFSVATGKSSRQRLQGTTGFNHLHNDPQAAAIFHRAMVELTGYATQAVVVNYDFSPYRCILDIGGGNGQLLCGILAENPATSGIILDLEHAAEGAKAVIEGSGVKDRCRFLAGDFFRSIPVDADLYLLKSVLHDWPDEDAIRILTTCHTAMRPDAKLLVCERVGEDNASSNTQEFSRSDLHMLVAFGGRERSLAELHRLLERAGFKLEHSKQIAMGLSLLEASPTRPAALQQQG